MLRATLATPSFTAGAGWSILMLVLVLAEGQHLRAGTHVEPSIPRAAPHWGGLRRRTAPRAPRVLPARHGRQGRLHRCTPLGQPRPTGMGKRPTQRGGRSRLSGWQGASVAGSLPSWGALSRWPDSPPVTIQPRPAQHLGRHSQPHSLGLAPAQMHRGECFVSGGVCVDRLFKEKKHEARRSFHSEQMWTRV